MRLQRLSNGSLKSDVAFSNCWNNSLQKSQALSALRLASEALAEHRTNATGEAAAPLHFMAGKTLLGYARNRSLLEWEQVGAGKHFFQNFNCNLGQFHRPTLCSYFLLLLLL